MQQYLYEDDFTILMPFPRKGEMGNYWKIGKQKEKNPILRHRRKVAFIHGSLQPLLDCSEEKGNQLQNRDN